MVDPNRRDDRGAIGHSRGVHARGRGGLEAVRGDRGVREVAAGVAADGRVGICE